LRRSGSAVPPDDEPKAPGADSPGDDNGSAAPDRAALSGAALRESFRLAFDGTFWTFLFLAAAAGSACWWVAGPETFFETLHGDVGVLVEILPRIIAAMAIAAFVQVLVPREAVARALGEKAGLKGIALAAGAGVVTPGGPMTSFPLVNALQAAGSGRSALVAYLTSWSVLGLQRILTWEVPLMGAEFATIRALASLPLPFIAAFTARLLPAAPNEPRG
jgi:uncharacterized membrane protein YraQ (UPF0718 family)